MMRFRASQVPAAVIAAAGCVLAVGIFLGVVLAAPAPPESIGPTLVSTTAPATRMETVDKRGATLEISVNDLPLISLATSRPLWRDLVAGDTGLDVRALRAELTRLGYRTTVDGRFGALTR